MKVKKIIRCICADHEPTSADSVHYGMPNLRVWGDDVQYWDIYCPDCGRGGLFEEKSSYKALQKWNELQMNLRNDNPFVE